MTMTMDLFQLRAHEGQKIIGEILQTMIEHKKYNVKNTMHKIAILYCFSPKDQESIQSQDSNGKVTNLLTVGHHKREPRGQPFPSR